MMSTEAFEEIVETFEFLDDWEDRYRHLIEIGRAMPAMDPALQTSVSKVDGCASQVWIVPTIENGRFDFIGDSDALIVRGLVAVVHALFAGLPVDEVAKVDAAAELGRLGLEEHLSAQRSNGLRAMVARIRDHAAAA